MRPGPHRGGRSQKCRTAPYVVGPDGSPLTLTDLPLPDTRRWTIARKAQVVVAVNGGLLTLDAACRRYSLTTEEYLAWESAFRRHGVPGLRATRVQEYRSATPAVAA